MKLIDKQFMFASLVPLLIQHAHKLGFTVTLGECYRSPQEAARLAKLGKGIIGSLHTMRLAIDLHLFRDGVYLTTSEAHRTLGTWWEMQSAGKDFICTWGGHWGDGNHYSITHGGKK